MSLAWTVSHIFPKSERQLAVQVLIQNYYWKSDNRVHKMSMKGRVAVGSKITSRCCSSVGMASYC